MIPPELVDALADLSVVEAVLYSTGLFTVTAVPLMALAHVDVRRLVESGCADRLLIVVGPVLHAARESARDAAALLILLTTRPQGALS